MLCVRKRCRVFVLLVSCVGVVFAAWARAEGPEGKKPSSYAPAKDLRGQVDAFVQKIAEDLANEADYGDDQKSRVTKDAHTLAVLALVLGMHDEVNELKPSAAAVVKAAGKLAAASGDFKQATAALAELKRAIAGAEGVEKLEWKPVADLSQLMKQVPIVNNNLRRTVTGKRFKQSLEVSAGQAATLAALAQASSFDTTYCNGKDAEAKWARLCGEMRDDAAEVQAAIRKGDQDAAKAGLDKLAKTCDACHHVFRDK